MFTFFKEFYPQVLNTLKSNTFVELSDGTIERILDDFTKRAIAAFRYPRVSLEYTTDGSGSYYFIEKNQVTQREVNVLLAHIKYYWLEQQFDDESNFEQIYFDKDIKLHSRGNLLSQLEKRMERAKSDLKSEVYNYGRLGVKNKTSFGDIYEK